MIEWVFRFPNWETALIVAVGFVTIQATMYIAIYNIGRTSREK